MQTLPKFTKFNLFTHSHSHSHSSFSSLLCCYLNQISPYKNFFHHSLQLTTNNNNKMQNLFLYCFSIFFFFSCTTQQLAYSKPFLFHTHKNNNRRILHEPFMPLNSLSPSQPPKPPPQPKPPLPSYSSTSTSTSTSTSNTKHPFSTTITTPNNNNNDDNNPNQDQSPFFPNYPPLSPPPPSPITFASFPANISSLVIPHTTQPTSSSNKLLPITLIAVSIAVAVVFAIFTFVYFRRRYRNRRAADNKSLRSDSSLELFPRNGETVAVAGTGSEFLYLGTVVNSRRIDDTQRSGVLDSRKLESPELRPLPPLARYPEPLPPPPRGGGGTCSEEEDEEFYSPRGSSLGGLESSGGTGSCSRRAFSAIAARKSGESSSISCSSSSFGSPEHSHSISLSPPASSSPPRTHSKSPETTPPHSVSTFSSQQHVQSSSQERVLEKNEDALSARVSNASNGSVKSIISSSSAFSLPSSPEKVMMMHHHSTFDQSPRLSSVSEGLKIPGLSSRPLSPSLLSSPEIERGGFNYTSNYAATVPHRKLWEIPIAPVPPPPPPLPLQRQRKHWGMPASSIPVGQSHQVLRPPELVPPSRPFVLQNTIINEGLGEIEETSKLKLKPLHWDKVRTSSDREMVWDHLKSSSFKLNEEMIETLFVVNNSNQNSKDAAPRSVLPLQNQEDRVLDPKKSQNIAILLKALNVTKEEVCEALLQGSADTLGTELLESLLKMAPSEEEIRKLKEHKDDSPTKLDVAEGFLKAVLDIPFAFKRVEAMLYMVNFESEVAYLRKSFQTLEAACEELRNCRMFLKLLEAVLKTGNRMNVGTNRGAAEAFKLDTLLKLADVKGADGKTTLLHFVVQEIIRTEGARLSDTNQTTSSTLTEDAKCRRLGLQVISSLSSELANVKRAATMDFEALNSDVFKLSKGIASITEIVKLNQKAGSNESSQKFTESMSTFIRMAEEEILKLQAQGNVALSLVKEITEYFHGNLTKEEAHPFRIFMVVRDFLSVLDRVCKEVGTINERTGVSSAHKFPVPVNPMLPIPLPGLHGRKQCSSNPSDDDSLSP